MKYNPHSYQTYATDFILSHPVSAVFLDMGLGKSVISLTAIFDLCLDSFEVRKVLVIAPLRVARDTWPTEIEKWDQLNGLSYSVAVGTEADRRAALMQKASVYIINRRADFRLISIWWSSMSCHRSKVTALRDSKAF